MFEVRGKYKKTKKRKFMLGTAFSFIGMGIGYILKITKKDYKKTNIKEK